MTTTDTRKITADELAEIVQRFDRMRDLAREGVQLIDPHNLAVRWASEARAMFTDFESAMTTAARAMPCGTPCRR